MSGGITSSTGRRNRAAKALADQISDWTAPGGARYNAGGFLGLSGGWTKLIDNRFGPEIGWLYPLALLALIAGLAWRGGVSIQTAVALQAVLARLRPAAIIKPGRAGNFPLTATEMRSELDLLGVSEAGLRAWIPRRLQRSEAQAEV